MESQDGTSCPTGETRGSLYLLIALVCLTVFSPLFLGEALLDKVLMLLFNAAVLVGAVHASHPEKRQFIIGLVLGGLAFLAGALGLADVHPYAGVAMTSLMAVFFASLEAATGVLYVAVLIAGLVGMYSRSAKAGSD